MQRRAVALGNSLAGPQKVKHVVTVRSSSATLRIYITDAAKRNGNYVHTRCYTCMCVATLFIIDEKWKQMFIN